MGHKADGATDVQPQTYEGITKNAHIVLCILAEANQKDGGEIAHSYLYRSLYSSSCTRFSKYC